MTTTYKSVSRANPCPVCEGDHKCSIGTDGSILCGRRTGDQPGFRCCGPCKKDETWTIYLPADSVNHPNGTQQTNGHHVDWNAKAKGFETNLTPEYRAKLGEALGLPQTVFESLGVGFSHSEGAWTFPEVDAKGNVIGINRRYESGEKKVMAGGHRGLSLPSGWDRGEGPILLVEGPTDTLAVFAMGLSVLGRPSNMGGVDHLAELLKTWPTDRPIIVVGENDRKITDDGKDEWPGRKGALHTATELANRLQRPILWALPPAMAKDIRVWANKVRQLDPTMADDWPEAGEQLCQELLAASHRIEPKEETKAAEAKPKYTFCPIDSEKFAVGQYRLEWIIRGMLVRRQPGLVGGPKKSLKTNILIDLGISIGSGLPFLGEFTVVEPLRTAILSGESGEHTLQETALRICAAKGIKLASVDCYWDFKLPSLASEEQMAVLAEGLKKYEIKVLIIDPLYLCLLCDAGQASAANLFDVGPLLLRISQTCLESDCTPILIHHARKNLTSTFDPLELEDLAFAGIQEFARQWLLINRRAPYQPGTGQHRLWLSAGGSVGHGGLWAADIDEGVLDDNFGGRTWQVQVIDAGTALKAKKDEAAAKVNEKRTAKEQDQERRLLSALDTLGGDQGTIGYTKVRDAAGLNGSQMEAVTHRLKQQNIIEETTIHVAAGNGAKRPVRALRRVREEGYQDTGTEHRDNCPDSFAEHHQEHQDGQDTPIGGVRPDVRPDVPSPKKKKQKRKRKVSR